MVINIGCCLSDFQVARPHAVCRIKENTHLKVDFREQSCVQGERNGGVFVGSAAFKKRCSLGGMCS